MWSKVKTSLREIKASNEKIDRRLLNGVFTISSNFKPLSEFIQEKEQESCEKSCWSSEVESLPKGGDVGTLELESIPADGDPPPSSGRKLGQAFEVSNLVAVKTK